jgi:sugar phosphate isomerase/epimerase
MTQDDAWLLSGFGDEISPDPRVQCAVLAALGARHIEVRSAWDTNIVEMDDDALHRLATVLKAEGLGCSAIASPIGKVPSDVEVGAEVTRLGRAANAARVLGARYIRIFSFYPAGGAAADEVRDDVLTRMRALADEAERQDVVLLHENEKEIYGDIPRRCLDVVESVGSPALRLAWDPANFVQVGVRPFDEGYAMLRPHVEYLQVKDALLADGTVVPSGEGDGQVEETVKALKGDGYVGYASMEPHLALSQDLGGFSGAEPFGRATRAFTAILDRVGVSYR